MHLVRTYYTLRALITARGGGKQCHTLCTSLADAPALTHIAADPRVGPFAPVRAS